MSLVNLSHPPTKTTLVENQVDLAEEAMDSNEYLASDILSFCSYLCKYFSIFMFVQKLDVLEF
jgi:hypothetical protein